VFFRGTTLFNHSSLYFL